MENLFLPFVILGLIHFAHVGFGGRFIYDEKQFELEKGTNIPNNGIVKTFPMGLGETVDCVYVYKQPAFDHPLLKNHTLEWKPRVVPKEADQASSFGNGKPMSFLSDDECPLNTIPIRRTSPKLHNNAAQNGRFYQFALLEKTYIPGDNIYGGMARISVNNPKVEYGRSSGASIWIGSDLSDQKNFIKAGWNVYPEVYGDDLSRLSIYWTGDGFHQTGCFDLQCPGFVQIDRKIVLGSSFSQTSKHGELRVDNYYYIFQDIATQNWWLMFGVADDHRYVGYWPKELFNRFGEGASVLHFGGSVMTQSTDNYPPMGDGSFPNGSTFDSTYFSSVHYVNKSNYLIPFSTLKARLYTDNYMCYLVKYEHERSEELQYTLYVGGPGGAC